MKSWSSSIVVIASLFLCNSLYPQARYTATRTTRIQAGAAGMYLNNDYGNNSNKGLVVYGDYDFTHWVGLEAEVRFGGLISPSDIGENTYLAGPRATYRHHRITGYGKFMIGRGTITNEITHGASSFNIFAYGAGLEYRIGTKFNVRAIDGEFQKWPGFAPHSLSPMAISTGIAYIIH